MLEESGGLTEGSRMMRKRGGASQLTLNQNAALERLLIFVDFFLSMKDVDVLCCVGSCASTRRLHLVSAHVCNPSGFTGVQILLFLNC